MSFYEQTPPARNLRHSKRTNDEAEQLRSQIMDVLGDDHPQSGRHVFYRMTDPRLPEPVSKDETGYRAVLHQLVKMRREGTLPYGWITDATRRGYHVFTFEDGADFLRQMAGQYRADAWRLSDHYVEVWTESRSIAGIIREECEELGVSLYPAGGFSSLSLAYEAAEQIKKQRRARDIEIIFIGDYDPAGVLIDRKIEEELRRHLPRGMPLRFHRIAITLDQIETYDLPTKPRKAGDKRSPEVKFTVEAEAMPAQLMRQLLRAAVERFMPQRALAIAKAAEESEQQGLLTLAKNWGKLDVSQAKTSAVRQENDITSFNREWHLFIVFLIRFCSAGVEGAYNHIGWLEGRFGSPWEWLGSEGAAYRKTYRIRDLAMFEEWQTFFSQYEGVPIAAILEEIDALAVAQGHGGGE